MAAPAIDKGKLLDQAQKYAQKGQIDKAIAEFQKVVDADPKDFKTRIRIGELYLKKGNKAAAVDEYSKVAQSYSRDGFNLQAIAVYKQLLKMDTTIFEIYVKLADLYGKQGLIADAVSNYRIVINHYEKQGKTREVIDALKKMASLDAENFSLRLKLAELYFKNGNKKEGIDEYLRIAEDLKKAGKNDEVVQIYLKLLTVSPSCSEALRGLGEVYFKTGRKKEALSRLQAAVGAEPNDVKALSLLAEVYIDQNEFAGARQTYEQILRADPSSSNAAKSLVSLYVKAGDRVAAAKAVMPVVDNAIEKSSYDSALGILLELYRNDVKGQAVLEKLADVYRLKGDKEKEIEIRSEIGSSSEKAAAKEAPKAEVREEEPILEMEDAQLEEVQLEDVPVEEIPLEDTDIELEEPEIEHSVEEHAVIVDEVAEAPKDDLSKYLTEAEVYVKYGLKDKAVSVLKTAHDLFPENVDVQKQLISLGVSLPDFNEATPQIEEEVSLELELPEEEIEVSGFNEIQDVEVPQIEEVPEIEEIPEIEEVADIEEVSEIEVSAEVNPLIKVNEDLERAEFYIQQGLYDEAREICISIVKSYPDNQEALLKLKAIDEALQVQAPQFEMTEEPAEEKSAEGFFDLAAELEGSDLKSMTVPSGMREAESFGFEDIFSEFKKGVESQLEKEDTETHYNLGIAYKEMGLLDDAIREFQIAAHDSKIEFDCYNLIGLCYIEKGAPQKAVESFKKGMGLGGRTDDEYASMSYELGQAYELSGMTDEALAAYTETQKKSPGFRDVESRLMGLNGGKEARKGRVSYV